MNKILILLCVLPFVTSCRMKPNVGIFEKDDIRFLGIINEQGESTYHILQLGTFYEPVKLENYKIGVELFEGQKALISDISIELLRSGEFTEEDYPPVEGYPEGTISLQKKCGSFIIYKQHIYSIYLGGRLWNEDFTKEFEIPISHSEAVELFGEPDLAYQTFFW